MVTGASSGIGEAIARELAAHGVAQLVLVARRADRLEELAIELKRAHGTGVEVLSADLADSEGLARVEARVADRTKPLDLVVNNAGFGVPGRFADQSADDLERLLDVNLVAVMRVMHASLGPMIERRKGSIMNIASLAAYQPTPGSATYAAGKAAVLYLGEAVYEELRGTGVTVTSVCPGYVRTEFQEHLDGDEFTNAPDFVWMTPQAIARAAVRATAAGKALCIPGVGYQIVAGLSIPWPRNAKRWLMGRSSGKATKLADRLGDKRGRSTD